MSTTYSQKTFRLKFESVKADQTRSIQAKKVLLPPTLSIAGDTLTITDNTANGNATEYFDVFIYNADTNDFVTGVRISADDGSTLGSLDESGNLTA